MKNLFFIATLISVLTITTALKPIEIIYPVANEVFLADDYCAGWEDGYCEGWKDVKGAMSLCPITPLCPLAELGRDKYKDGYNRGFKAGYRAAQK